MKTKKIICCFLLCLTFQANADIYRYTDAEGNVVYSDIPNIKAEPIVLPKENVSRTPVQRKSFSTDTLENQTDSTNLNSEEPIVDTKENRKEYTTFVMLTPRDQETFQNPTEITVSVQVDPPLQKGDLIQYFLDDKPFGTPTTSTVISIPKTTSNVGPPILERGSYTVSAALLNENNQPIRTTTPVTIFVHYHSINLPATPIVPPVVR